MTKAQEWISKEYDAFSLLLPMTMHPVSSSCIESDYKFALPADNPRTCRLQAQARMLLCELKHTCQLLQLLGTQHLCLISYVYSLQ
jgi:hypothetical protein